jgi:hypothetical protein
VSCFISMIPSSNLSVHLLKMKIELSKLSHFHDPKLRSNSLISFKATPQSSCLNQFCNFFFVFL